MYGGIGVSAPSLHRESTDYCGIDCIISSNYSVSTVKSFCLHAIVENTV